MNIIKSICDLNYKLLRFRKFKCQKASKPRFFHVFWSFLMTWLPEKKISKKNIFDKICIPLGQFRKFYAKLISITEKNHSKILYIE